MNLLIKAPTGYGKTTLARMIIYQVDRTSYYNTIPDSNGEVSLDLTRRVIFVDEVHYLKQQELLYPMMDRRKHIVILATNESGKLKEALVRRCVPLIFEEYTLVEMEYIVRDRFTSRGMEVPDVVISTITKNTNNSPGIADVLCERLFYVFSSYKIPQTKEETIEILRDYLGITDGLTPEHRRYLSFLSQQGMASLDTLSAGIGLDKDLIRNVIEPYLIRTGRVKITPKGRKYDHS